MKFAPWPKHKQFKLARAATGVVEMMERRTLLSAGAVLSNGTLTITGTNQADSILVAIDVQGDPTTDTLKVTINGTSSSFTPSAVNAITIQALGGNDSVGVDGAQDDPLPGPGNSGRFISISILGGDGNDSIGVGVETYLTPGPTVYADGGSGNDQITVSGDGPCIIHGGSGNDPLDVEANSGNPMELNNLPSKFLFGDSGNDTLTEGSAGASGFQFVAMYGGDGNDQFINGDPVDDYATISGGAGTDTILLNQDTAGGIIALDGQNHGGNYFVQADVENVKGMVNFPPTEIIGNNSNNVIDVNMDGYPATIFGGGGNDTITVNQSQGLVVHGGDGNDTIDASDSNASLYGDGGNDTIRPGVSGSYFISGGAGSDVADYSAHTGKLVFYPDGSKLSGDVANPTDTFDGSVEMFEAGSGIVLSDGILVINGTNGADNIHVALDVEAGTPDTAPVVGTITVTINGIDTLLDASSIGKIQVNGLGGNDTILEDGSDGFEFDAVPSTLAGGSGDDQITDTMFWFGSDYSADSLDGGVGNDNLHVEAGDGNYTLNGGDGNDTLNSDGELNGAGHSTYFGGAGDDRLMYFEDITYVMNGGPGIDTLDTTEADPSPSRITLDGLADDGWADDMNNNFMPDIENIYYPNGFDNTGPQLLIQGSSAGNRIELDGAEFATINGEGGNDTIIGISGDDLSINGGDGNDDIRTTDVLLSTVNGGSGNDLFHIGASQFTGGNQYIGGPGTDTADYTARTDNLVIYPDGSQLSGDVLNPSDTFDGTTEVFKTPSGTLSGGNLVVTGTNSADVISLTFDDTTPEGNITAAINGLPTATFDGNQVQQIHVNALGGNDTITEQGRFEGTRYIPSTLSGGDGNDQITDELNIGDSALRFVSADSLDGGGGDDNLLVAGEAIGFYTLNGGDGNDTLFDHVDNSGADTAVENGGSGNDTFLWYEDNGIEVHGGAGIDTLDTSPADDSGPLNVDMNGGGGGIDGGFTLGPDLENVIVGNSNWSSITVTGNSANNNIFVAGDQGNVTVSGGDGNDVIDVVGGANVVINGNGGNDQLGGEQDQHVTLDGGAGNDTLRPSPTGTNSLIGGSGNDIVDYSARTDDLVVYLDGSQLSGDKASPTDSFDGTVEYVYGGSGNDLLVGTTGNNALYGNGGNDTLISNGGVDALWGGAGNDLIQAKNNSYSYIDAGSGNDTVQADLADTVLNAEHVSH